jgi:prophage regulatory protein
MSENLLLQIHNSPLTPVVKSIPGDYADMAISKKGIDNRPIPRDLNRHSGEAESPLPLGDETLRTAPIRLLRLAQVIDITGLGKTKIYELQSQGSFPMRVQITAHSVGWIEAEVQTWLARRVAASNSLPARPRPQVLRRPSP